MKFVSSGFTLVELLIVIGVLGILTVGLLLTLDPVAQIQRGRDAKRKDDLSQLQRALELFYQDHGWYPKSGTQAQGCLNQIYDSSCKAWGDAWGNYMSKIPKEAATNRNYVYFAPTPAPSGNPQYYYLYSSLERGGKDQQACFNDNVVGGTACTNAAANSLTCGTNITCSFGVSSSNTTP